MDQWALCQGWVAHPDASGLAVLKSSLEVDGAPLSLRSHTVRSFPVVPMVSCRSSRSI